MYVLCMYVCIMYVCPVCLSVCLYVCMHACMLYQPNAYTHTHTHTQAKNQEASYVGAQAANSANALAQVCAYTYDTSDTFVF